LILEKPRPDGWRRGTFQVVNRLDNNLSLDVIEVLDPPRSEITTEDRSPRGELSPRRRDATASIEFKRTLPSGVGGGSLYIRAIANRSVIVRFSLHEIACPHRDWSREVEAENTP
jgi:hypothetical protein